MLRFPIYEEASPSYYSMVKLLFPFIVLLFLVAGKPPALSQTPVESPDSREPAFTETHWDKLFKRSGHRTQIIVHLIRNGDKISGTFKHDEYEATPHPCDFHAVAESTIDGKSVLIKQVKPVAPCPEFARFSGSPNKIEWRIAMDDYSTREMLVISEQTDKEYVATVGKTFDLRLYLVGSEKEEASDLGPPKIVAADVRFSRWTLAQTKSPMDDTVAYVLSMSGRSDQAQAAEIAVVVSVFPKRAASQEQVTQRALRAMSGRSGNVDVAVVFRSDHMIDARASSIGHSEDLIALGRTRWGASDPEMSTWTTRDLRAARLLNSGAFVQRLLHSSTLKIELPAISGAFVAEFDVAGLQEKLKECPPTVRHAVEQTAYPR